MRTSNISVRLLSLLCCFVLLFGSMMPAGFAEELAAPQEEVEQVEIIEEVIEEPEIIEEPEEPAPVTETPAEEPAAPPTEAPTEEPVSTPETAEEAPTEAPMDGPDATQEPQLEGETELSIAFVEAQAVLTVGDSHTVAYRIEPEGSEAPEIHWESSDASVAVVDEGGVVFALAPGNAVIQAVLPGGSTAQCAVEVREAPFSLGYARVEPETKEFFEEEDLKKLYFTLNQDDVLYVLEREITPEADVMKIAVATAEEVVYGWTPSEGIAPLDEEAILAYQQDIGEDGLSLPEDAAILLAPMEIAFALNEDKTEGIATTVQDAAAPLWSGAFPEALGDSALLERANGSDEGAGSLGSALLSGLGGWVEEIDLEGYALTADELRSAYQALLDAQLSLFYVSGAYEIDLLDAQVVRMRPVYTFDAETTAAHQSVINAGVQKLVKETNEATSTLQKIFWLHNALAEQMDYTPGGAISPEAFFADQGGASQGFTYAFQAALESLNIPGSFARSAEMDYAWNMVKLDGKWYHADVAAHKQFLNEDWVTFEYLMASDAMIREGALPHSGWLAAYAATDDAYMGYDWIGLLPSIEGEVELFRDGAIARIPAEEDRVSPLSRAVTFDSHVLAGLAKEAASIDVSAYNLTGSNFEKKYEDLLNRRPETFYVGNYYRYWVYAGKVTRLEPTYKYKGQARTNAIKEFEYNTDQILATVPSGLSALEKVLYINDYMAVNFAYDAALKIYSPELLFSKQTGVCQAYALAFQHLMNELGVTCSYVTSEAMNHIWNQVKIGSNWYHVDVTWNDPMTSDNQDIAGYAGHYYFMLSDSEMYDYPYGHHSWAANYSCSSTTYDNYFWWNVTVPFAYLDGNWYYARSADGSSTTAEIVKWGGSANSVSRVYQFNAGYSPYATVISHNGKLLYNTTSAIWEVDATGTGAVQKYAPSTTGQVSGLYRKGYVYYKLNDSGVTTSKRLTNAMISGMEVPVTGIKLNKAAHTLKAGKTYTLKATVSPSTATNKAVTWKSSNTSIATVSATGIVVAKKNGKATITATTKEGKLVATCNIYVGASVTGVKLNSTSKTLKVGAAFTLKGTISPSNAANKTITWKSSNTAIATVNSSGKVTGKAVGDVTITATTQDGSKAVKCTVKVRPAVTGVKLNVAVKTVKVGAAYTLKATISPSNAAIKTVTWKSSNTKVATVDKNGKVTGVKKGNVTITATTTDGKKVATAKIYIGNPVTKIKFSAASKTLKIGTSTTVKPVFTPADAQNKTLTWKSSNTSIATVNSSGKVTGKGVGDAKITATSQDGKKVASYTVKVRPAVTSVKLNVAQRTVKVGATYTLKATISPSNAAIKTVTWKSSNTKIATVDKNGKVKGIKAGKATITATTTDGKKVATAIIYVGNPVTAVKLNKTSATIKSNATYTLKATFTPASPANKILIWTSSDTSVATVSSKGVVTAVAPGTTTITVKTQDAGKTAKCTITVVQAVAGVTLSPAAQTVSIGSTFQLTATVAPLDAADQTLTWVSDNPACASVDANGLVTAIATGTANLTVTTKDGGFKETCVITVP